MPHGPARPLTCPHESILAVAVIDIALLLWKEKRGSSGEAACQAWGREWQHRQEHQRFPRPREVQNGKRRGASQAPTTPALLPNG